MGAETEVEGRCRHSGTSPEVMWVWLLGGGRVVEAAGAGVTEVEWDGRTGVDGAGVLHRTVAAGGEGQGRGGGERERGKGEGEVRGGRGRGEGEGGEGAKEQ